MSCWHIGCLFHVSPQLDRYDSDSALLCAVDSVGRHGANGFAAFSALPSADSSALELQRSKRQEHHDGDLVAAEQDK